ncbi:MAG: hypothetical protein J3R72DRAFT_123976 [Linnemannia gamsii]|nr:MAG: hypothetical protein J3R72DRAFT_123976 [Linnemannia gamsii]
MCMNVYVCWFFYLAHSFFSSFSSSSPPHFIDPFVLIAYGKEKKRDCEHFSFWFSILYFDVEHFFCSFSLMGVRNRLFQQPCLRVFIQPIIMVYEPWKKRKGEERKRREDKSNYRERN